MLLGVVGVFECLVVFVLFVSASVVGFGVLSCFLLLVLVLVLFGLLGWCLVLFWFLVLGALSWLSGCFGVFGVSLCLLCSMG